MFENTIRKMISLYVREYVQNIIIDPIIEIINNNEDINIFMEENKNIKNIIYNIYLKIKKSEPLNYEELINAISEQISYMGDVGMLEITIISTILDVYNIGFNIYNKSVYDNLLSQIDITFDFIYEKNLEKIKESYILVEEILENTNQDIMILVENVQNNENINKFSINLVNNKNRFIEIFEYLGNYLSQNLTSVKIKRYLVK